MCRLAVLKTECSVKVHILPMQHVYNRSRIYGTINAEIASRRRTSARPFSHLAVFHVAQASSLRSKQSGSHFDQSPTILIAWQAGSLPHAN